LSNKCEPIIDLRGANQRVKDNKRNKRVTRSFGIEIDRSSPQLMAMEMEMEEMLTKERLDGLRREGLPLSSPVL
jgi:hypothetical protein